MDLERSDVARVMLANVPGSIAVAIVSFGLGLLIRSLGSAITVAPTFVFVLAGVFSPLPGSGMSRPAVDRDCGAARRGPGPGRCRFLRRDRGEAARLVCRP